MNYILAVSIENQVYRTPNLEFRLNERLLDSIDLTENHSIDIDRVKKSFIYDLWGIKHDKSCTHDAGGPTMVDVLRSKKWFFFEIDENNFVDKNKVSVSCKNFSTNNTNGFMTKWDQYKILDVLFLPKKYFIDIKKIFEYCTSKNILANWMWCTDQTPYALGNGWPMIPALKASGMTSQSDEEILKFHGLSTNDKVPDEIRYHDDIWVNQDREISIIWDERLGLFRLCNLTNHAQYGLDFDHILLSDYKKYCVKHHADKKLTAENIVVPRPDSNFQPNFTVNNETTYLVIHAPVIILLHNFLKNKYIYEDK